MDFRMDVWMGWEQPARSIDQLFIVIGGRAGGGIAEFGLAFLGGPPELVATNPAGAIRAPPPAPGMHQFTITRSESEFNFYLDGQHFGELPDIRGIEAAGVSLFFGKPFPGEMNPYHIDRVRVIPAPSSLLLPMAVAGACIRRRRPLRWQPRITPSSAASTD